MKQHPAFSMLDPFAAQHAVDLTAFLGQWPTRLQIHATASDLLNMADRFNLEGLCVSHFASIFGFDTRSGNEALFHETAGDSRLWPFVILNPSELAWEEELEWAIQSGARGVRIVPGYHGYSLLIPQVETLVERLKEARLPLHVCVRLEDERLQHPRFKAETPPYYELAELLRLCDDLPTIISGLRVREWSSVTELLNVGHQTDNVLLDLWFTNGPIRTIASWCHKGEADLMGYGSCAPLQIPEATIMQLATADISNEERAALCKNNALRILRS